MNAKRISQAELFIYGILFFGIFSYVFYECVYFTLTESDNIYGRMSFAKGWRILGKLRRDHNDVEWALHMNFLTKMIMISVTYVIFGVVTSKMPMGVRQVAHIGFTLAVTTYLCQWRLTVYLLVQVAIYYWAALAAEHILAVWAVGLCFFALTTFETLFSYAFWPIFGQNVGIAFNFAAWAQAMNMIRSVAYCYEMLHGSGEERAASGGKAGGECGAQCNVPQPQPVGRSLMAMLQYCFYYPSFFVGPFLMPQRFFADFSCLPQWTWPRVRLLATKTLRLVLYLVGFEFLLHICHLYAWIGSAYELSRVSSDWVLVGCISMLPGIFFQLKYAYIWGLPNLLSNFDGVYSPDCPYCVTRIVQYSEMWRLFDVGLYHFLRSYIYVPLGGSKATWTTRIGASVLCFLYIGYWHGASERMLVWVLLSFVVVLLEAAGPTVCASPLLQRYVSRLSGPWQWRLRRALMLVPYYLSTVSLVFFFGDGRPSLAVYARRLGANPLVIVAQLLLYYSLIHLSDECDIWRRARTKSKHC